MPRIEGRIIRILNNRTAIVNLGSNDGIQRDSEFRILGDPEVVVDPVTNEELGSVVVVKAKLKAEQVHPKFTIVSTKWMIERFRPSSLVLLAESLQSMYQTEVVDEGELRVLPDEVRPWKAQSEIPVRIGDPVEVTVPRVIDKGLTQIEEGQEDAVASQADDK